MRLGLVLDQVLFDGGGRYSTDEAFIRFLEAAVGPEFDQIDFCARVRHTDVAGPYPLDPARFTVRALPWYSDVGALCSRAPWLLPRIARLFDGCMSGWDLVLAGGIHPLSSLALSMARRRRIPTQLWVRGDLDADVRFKHRGAARLAARAVARLATATIPRGTPVVSIGREDYAFLERMGPVHVGFDSKFGHEDIAPCPRTLPASGPTRLLYVGRLSPEKGVDLLLDAFARLAAHRPDLTLTMAGADFVGSSYGDAFRRRVEQSPVGGRVTLAGYVPYGPRLFAVYDDHDLLVLPSLTEGFPQVVLESMARGLPVVATRVGGVPGIVRDGENGALVPPGDPGALASGIERVLSDAQLWARSSREGLASAAIYARQAQVAALKRFTADCLQASRGTEGTRVAPVDDRDAPLVSVVLPVRNESRFIRGCLESVLAQDYPPDRMEIIVADGMSTDDTCAIVDSVGRRHSTLRVVPNRGAITTAGLNAAIAAAHGEVIVRVDGHCEIARDYVRCCVAHLRDGADAVGGRLETIGVTFVARAIARAMNSRFGVGNAAFRTGGSGTRDVDTVAFPAYPRAVLERLGPLDEDLVRNEDDEYNYRLRKHGGRIRLADDVHAKYYSRGSLGALWRQYLLYGYWKVRVLQKHPFQMCARQFAPPLFVTSLLGAALVRALMPAVGWAPLAWIGGGYAAAAIVASLYASGGDLGMMGILPLVFGILHVSYGIGFLAGLAIFRHQWRASGRQPVSPRQWLGRDEGTHDVDRRNAA